MTSHLTVIRERHREDPVPDPYGTWCALCGQAWPCDAARLGEALDAAESELVLSTAQTLRERLYLTEARKGLLKIRDEAHDVFIEAEARAALKASE